jgi:methylthioribose-1-phosphate isomerase
MLKTSARVEPIRWTGHSLQLLDQRKLPNESVYVDCHDAGEVAGAIRDMIVRGAPAIGVAAAFGLALAARRSDDLRSAADDLRSARPTAVNLAWAVDRMMAAADRGDDLEREAQRIFDEDIESAATAPPSSAAPPRC